MIATLDLSLTRPLITLNGDTLQGVTRAEVQLTPDDVPVLVLRISLFKVIGGTCPHGMTRMSEGPHDGVKL